MRTKSLLCLSILLCSSFANMGYAMAKMGVLVDYTITACKLCTCCCCSVGCCLALHAYPSEQTPHEFLANYQPRFEDFASADAMAQCYCPDFLRAGPEEQKMTDLILACDGLTNLKQRSNQSHNIMLKKLSNAFPSRPAGYEYAVNKASESHQKHLAQIALAKMKCGCEKENKKTK